MLRTFEVAARRMSFSLAAEELNISQAAVSQQIRNLEAYLGSPLFLRNNRKLSLSGTGSAYFGAVHEALDRLDAVTDQLFPDRPNQTVTISCSSSIAMLWLAPNIRAFHLAHPAIRLRIQTLDAEAIAARTSGADLEIFVSAKDPNDPHDPGTRLLLTSAVTPVAAPTVFDNGARPQVAADILAHDLIHVTGYDADWHRWFHTYGLDKATVPSGLIVDGSLIALETALHGEGIVLGRRPFIDQYLRSGQLIEVFATGFALSANYYLRQPATRTARRCVDQVAQWLTQMAKHG